MIDYARINGAHCVLIGAERMPSGVRRTWMLWSNGESTWADFADEKPRTIHGGRVLMSHMVASGHGAPPPHVEMSPPTVPMVAAGPIAN